MSNYDVVVVGAGNAALCAAMAARENGASVLILEKASEDEKGGNSYFTAGGFRFCHSGIEDAASDVLTDLSDAERDQIVLPVHDRDVFYDTLMKVTHHQADEDMAHQLIDGSRTTMVWLREHGIRFIPMFGRQSFLVDGKHHFYGGVNIEAVGGGAGLVEAELARAAKLGCDIRYGTGATRLIQDQQRRITGLEVRGPDGYEEIETKAVVLACGGFESNPEMRVRYLGPGWDLCRVRGTRHNTGDGIRMAIDIGARPYGNWSGCHSVGWDISAPPYGDRVVLDNFQKHSYPWGIMVNLKGERFVDEGEDLRNLTYVRFGREIMSQPFRTAIQIFDQKTIPLLRDEYRIREVTKYTADSIEALSAQLEVSPSALKATIDEFNAACQPGDYNPAVLDGVTTEGLAINKTNWALPINEPPFEAYVTTTGITFTFGGLRINKDGEVQDLSDRSIPGLYAAGELVGGLFFENYPGGSGLMAGSVFGKLAGDSAAAYVS
ncbi:MAG: FAD-dependent tricarballylate dehydrogenase TcuA [Rhodospirillaceae bacterium]|jgi:tricarballylate dehydrogenase|nr:FAD-dependent tricarballylate dehydrogenase TcuA [Rhodospirillaceae bacterium]MBT5266949.1 FAD-dependent tricarballylate dehydrogenase TcuA [Rhodospirillaceae bacterium]MBT6136458.1 FAD-dependent tricarballylate dehydrogenase TcuA [Rhodospirillaceae bacterium]